MAAARAEIDRRWAIRTAKINEHNRREMALAFDLAELDGRTEPDVADLQDAWRALDNERIRIMRQPW
jgi:hypothetical protein